MQNFNLLNNNLSSYLKKFIFYIFIIQIIFFFIITVLVQKGVSFDNDVFQEWLINYSQGFVRRGLPGTFFLFLQKQYNVDIYKTIKYFAFLTFLLFSTMYIIKVRESKKILNLEALMVVLFLPSLILFPIYNISVIGRKEFFFFFGLLINLFFLKKTFRTLNTHRDSENSLRSHQISAYAVNKYCRSLFFCYNLLSIPTALSHEAIIFLALPLNMVITSNFLGLTFSKRQVLLRTLIIYLPTILVSFVCLIFKGNDLTVLGICQSWQEYNRIYRDLTADCSLKLPHVLEAFGASINYALAELWEKNISQGNGSAFFSWIFVFFLNIVILMRTSSSIIINSVENLKRKISGQEDFNFPSSVDIVTNFSFKYAFIPFIFSFIMYVIAVDWGRWFFIISITYTLCLLSPSLICLEIAIYHQNKGILKCLSPIYSIYSKVIGYLHNQYLSQRFSAIYLLLFIYTLFILKIPYFNMNIEHLYRYYPFFIIHSFIH